MNKILSFDNFKMNELSSGLADRASKLANDKERYGQAATFNNYAVNSSFGEFISKMFTSGDGSNFYTILEINMSGNIKIKKRDNLRPSVIYVQYDKDNDRFRIDSKNSTDETILSEKLYIDKQGGQLFWKIAKKLNPETKVTPNNLGELVVKK